ncbi:hypothetical protein GGI21_002930, partial [Coemansia aciculifera]
MTAATTTTMRDDKHLARSLDVCERQLSEATFAEPLDVTQVRKLANFERMLENIGKQQHVSSTYQQRADNIAKQLRPWIEKRDALLSALNVVSDSGEKVDPPAEEQKAQLAHAKPDLKRRSSLAEKREELLGEMDGLRRRGVVPNSVEGVERLLKSQRATQEELTSDLVQMASVLKKNSVAFGDLIEKDKTVIEETSDLLNGNVAGVSKHGARLNKYRKRAWGTT